MSGSTAQVAQVALPTMHNPFELSVQSVESFRRDGHVLLRGLATPNETDQYRRIITDAAMAHNTESRPIEQRETYGKAFLQVMNLWREDAGVERFVMAKRFARAAAELLGVSGVRIYHDQALFKEPGGGPTPFHQDHYYWPIDEAGAITMWMPLVDVPAEVGSLNFVSGSHLLGFLGEYEISDESEQAFADLIERLELPLVTHGAMAAGDATFHDGWTLHGAPGNTSSDMRAVMTVIYVADTAVVTEPTSEARTMDLARWLPGLVAGDRVASKINPLVYSQDGC